MIGGKFSAGKILKDRSAPLLSPAPQTKGMAAADFATAAAAVSGPGFPAALSERSEFSGRPARAPTAREARRAGSA